ncbi:MAG: L-dopachrome tautomerase-related protein [Woeseiaceae bacterium]
MKKVVLFILFLVMVLATIVRIRYGGGEPYRDLTTTPVISADQLQEVLSYREPIGNVAVSASGRVFFTVHPESRPQGNKLLQYVAGASVPFPDLQSQRELFDTVLGVVIDQQNRLWTIDHGNHGLRPPRLLGFDLESGDVIHDRRFNELLAPIGSFLQDLQVSPDGRTIVIADASVWRKSPALIVYNIDTSTARRVLEEHESVSAEPYVIRNHGEEMNFGGGLATLRAGVDGIAINDDWLYFGALSGSALYRVALETLIDPNSSNNDIAAAVERHSDKPLSDGLSINTVGSVFVTDVEHGAIFRIADNRQLDTLLRSSSIRWPDALSFGPDGWLYIADSALRDVILKSPDHIKSQGPYKIFRVQTDTEGTPGQ